VTFAKRSLAKRPFPDYIPTVRPVRPQLPLAYRLAIAGLLLGAYLLMIDGCSRYEVSKRQTGDQEQLVRIDKATGKTEVMGSDGTWRPVAERPGAPSASIEQATARVRAEMAATRAANAPRPLGQSEITGLEVSGAIEWNYGYPKLALTVRNGTRFTLREITVEVDYEDMPRVYKLTPAASYVGMLPGSRETLETSIQNYPFDHTPEWKIVQIVGKS
jgi:hypothetical protein